MQISINNICLIKVNNILYLLEVLYMKFGIDY